MSQVNTFWGGTIYFAVDGTKNVLQKCAAMSKLYNNYPSDENFSMWFNLHCIISYKSSDLFWNQLNR